MRGPLLTLALLCSPAAALADDAVLKSLPAEQLEKFLKAEKLDFKKSSSADPKEDVNYYDFARGKYQVRLTSFAGKDLMLDSVFGALPFDAVNRWNILAKFTRATGQIGAKKEALTILEYNLDLVGGVTEGTLKQYLVRFDQEMKDFEAFLLSNASDMRILATVPDDRIEAILKGVNVTWDKKPGSAEAPSVFDFTIDKQAIRLRNYAGKELLLAAKVSPVDLPSINEYNLGRKFVRAVNYKTKDNKDLTVLEAAFDCEPGVTEAMVRHYILAFVEDAKNFAEYTQAKQPPKGKE